MSSSSSLYDQPIDNAESIENQEIDNIFLQNVLQELQTLDTEILIGDDQTIEDIRMDLPHWLRKLADNGTVEIENGQGVPIDIQNYLSRHVDAENEPEDSPMDDAVSPSFQPENDK